MTNEAGQSIMHIQVLLLFLGCLWLELYGVVDSVLHTEF